MVLFKQILALTLAFLLLFFLIRAMLWHVLVLTVGKRKRKSIAKCTFYEWILMKKYVNAIPRWQIMWYYSNALVYVLCVAVLIVLFCCNVSVAGWEICRGYLTGYTISLIAMALKYPLK